MQCWDVMVGNVAEAGRKTFLEEWFGIKKVPPFKCVLLVTGGMVSHFFAFVKGNLSPVHSGQRGRFS